MAETAKQGMLPHAAGKSAVDQMSLDAFYSPPRPFNMVESLVIASQFHNWREGRNLRLALSSATLVARLRPKL